MFHIINGQIKSSQDLCISAFDRGLTLGHGLFETILANNNKLPLLKYHWKRLVDSASKLDINLTFDYRSLNQMILKLLSMNQLGNQVAVLRLTITDGISSRGLISTIKQAPTYILTAAPILNKNNATLSATIVSIKRNELSPTCNIKTISFLDNVLAKKEAVTKGYDEAFLLNTKAEVAEGAISNIFVVKNNIIYTPPVSSGALPGIIRSILLKKIFYKNIQEKIIHTKELLEADEIFISNALIGIKPIHQVDDKIYKNFALTMQLKNALKEKFNYI